MTKSSNNKFSINLDAFITRADGLCNFDPDHIDLIQKLHERCETDMNCEALWIEQNMTSLQEAVVHHSLVELKNLLLGGVDINSLDWSGITPLSTAVVCDFQLGLNYLLNSGACINFNDHWGLTTLHYAIICKNLYITEYLLIKGADINFKSEYRGETVLNWAARNNLPLRVNFLLDRGADPNLENDDGCVPLFYASHHDNVKMAESLIKNGADVNHKSNSGWTALHYAAKASSLQIVRMLLLFGADPNARSIWGIHPLHCANPGLPLVAGLPPLVETLIAGGTSLSFPYNSNLTITEYFESCCKQSSLERYYILFKSANLTRMLNISDQERRDLNFLNEKSIAYEEHCRTELLAMKNIQFGNFSLYSVLASLNNHNIKFVNNPDLRSFIESPTLQTSCPRYCTLITEAYGRAQIRQKLHEVICNRGLNDDGFGKLLCLIPPEIILNILSYLGDKDLGSVVKSFVLSGESASFIRGYSENNC